MRPFGLSSSRNDAADETKSLRSASSVAASMSCRQNKEVTQSLTRGDMLLTGIFVSAFVIWRALLVSDMCSRSNRRDLPQSWAPKMAKKMKPKPKRNATLKTVHIVHSPVSNVYSSKYIKRQPRPFRVFRRCSVRSVCSLRLRCAAELDPRKDISCNIAPFYNQNLPDCGR